jgi:protein-disulfide isomerase
MKRYLPFLIVGLVGLLTVAGGTLLYRAKRPPVLTIPKNESAAVKEGDETMHVRGNPKAAVTLEEFSDFQCPLCGRLAEPIREFEDEFGDRLRVIFHYFPLVSHIHAREAAYAAEAAGLQGHFWEMHDLLFKEQAAWSTADDARALFVSYATRLKLDADRLSKDMTSEKVKDRVDADVKRGNTLGVTVTPTIFINNTALPATSLNRAGLRAAIDDAMANPAGEKK